MNSLQFRILSDEEALNFERTPHNPPSYTEAFTKDDFSREWRATRAALKKRLEQCGSEWQLSTATGDFLLAESRGDSRWIYVTFVSTELWRPEFIPSVSEFLASLSSDYRVACLTELTDTADPCFEEPLVYLLISAHSVCGKAVHVRVDSEGNIVKSPANEVLARFGFPRAALSSKGADTA